MNTKRNQKDTVYRMLFRKPENALSLYNGLNGTDYKDVSKLEFNTLENAIYMGMKNDLSFLIMEQMNLYEQQATYNPNLPLRDLLYVADLLQVYAKDKTLYSSRQLQVPTPRFVVFYNGVEEKPEHMELKLSDAYEVPLPKPELELTVQVLNINPGMNEKLKEKCMVLKEYVTYVETIRSYAKSMPLKEAVEQAVEDCIENNVLREFLRKQRAEVVKMSIYEYDEEREMRLIREDEREIGREEERKKTEAEKRRAEAERKEKEQEKENAIKSIVSLCKEFGTTKEKAIEKLMEKCSIGRERAEEKVENYWK